MEGGGFVVVRLTADDGTTGVGEAFVWLPETGVSPAQVVDAIAHGLARYLLGASPFDVRQLRGRTDANVARSEVAKGLLDMACYDLMGHVEHENHGAQATYRALGMSETGYRVFEQATRERSGR